jgi:toxin ParE1/3/4
MADDERNVAKFRAAIFDIVTIADYLACNTSLTVSDRFVAAIEKTCMRLARMPGIGSRWEDEDPELTEVRVFPVSKFKNYLIYYRPTADGIEVLRVIHGARDTRRLLETDDDE